MTIFYVMIFCAIIGFFIGQRKGYGFQGFIAGGFLGVIGWIWIASLKPRWRCPACGGAVEKGFRRCKNCGAEISTQESVPGAIASIQPSQVVPRPVAKKKSIAGYVLFVLALILISIIYSQKNKISLPDIGGTSIKVQSITMNKYLQIQDGMSYEAVVRILGRNGEESSRNKIDAIPGVMEVVESVMYQWTNGDGTGMNAIFQNNKLFQKAQFGLE